MTSAPITKLLPDRGTVLVCAPEEADRREACAELLAVGGQDRENVLAVTYERTPDEWLAWWRDAVGSLPARSAVISACDFTRSAAAAGGGSVEPAPQPGRIAIETVPAEDTGHIGVTVLRYLDACGIDLEGTTGRSFSLCLDSLDALLRHENRESTFRFLHTLTRLLDRAGALAHVHARPGELDPATLAVFEPLFDATIERAPPNAPGAWAVREGGSNGGDEPGSDRRPGTGDAPGPDRRSDGSRRP